jgi:hypothetical protein
METQGMKYDISIPKRLLEVKEISDTLLDHSGCPDDASSKFVEVSLTLALQALQAYESALEIAQKEDA